MWFVLQWFQFIKLIIFHFLFEHIINNDQQSSTFSKYSCYVWKGGYQPLGGGSVEQWDNELEYKMLLISNSWKTVLVKW